MTLHRGFPEVVLMAISTAMAFIGIWLAYIYFRRPEWSESFGRSYAGRSMHAFFLSGWEFDCLYDWVFVRPFKAIAMANRRDFIDKFFTGLAALARYGNIGLSATQTGRVRNYVAGIVLGAIVVAAIVMLR